MSSRAHIARLLLGLLLIFGGAPAQAEGQPASPSASPPVATGSLTTPGNSDEAELLFRQANDAFLAGHYDEAQALYHRLIDAGFGTADVHYNLGCAALKAGRIGEAVLAFERALRLDPGHEDARANLEAALSRNVDELVGADAGRPFFERLARRLPYRFVAWGFVATWALFFLSLLLRRLAPIRWAATLAASLGGLGVVVLGLLLADLTWYRDLVHRAVVVAEAASVRKGPSPRFETAFEVHQGLVVRHLETDGPYVRVRLANGLEGWIRRTDVEAVAEGEVDSSAR
jgi:hypothetical protein